MKSTRWGLGLLGVAGLLLSVTADANAWLFHHGCGHCCDMHICCRQYNAFTPVCFGNIFCDGCCPNFGCAPMNLGCGPACGMPGPVCSAVGGFPMMAGWGDPHTGMAMQMPMQMPAMLPPGTPIPTSLPTPGAPLPPGAPMPPGPSTPPGGNVPPILNHTAQYTSPAYYGYGVQPASYHPGYYGYYANPYGYNPYAYWAAMANPYYGYGYGYGQQQPQQPQQPR